MITKQVSVYPTPEECANEFANAGSVWQVRFLNALAGHAFWEAQLYYVTKDEALTPEARKLMNLIGAYSTDVGL
jgi:hypothetical protein